MMRGPPRSTLFPCTALSRSRRQGVRPQSKSRTAGAVSTKARNAAWTPARPPLGAVRGGARPRPVGRFGPSLAAQGDEERVQLLGADEDVARLRPLARPDDTAALHEVHEPAGLGEADAQLALQH